MRFGELQLLRYGRFEDCRLTFAAGDCDLQLILGPNEAGKSTTLEAVGDLLFGFPGRTRFAFRFDQRLLRVGAVLEADGVRLEVRRRKGNVDTLLGSDEQPIEPGRLSVLLAGQTRESFERMFGLDHKRLRAGGEAILAAKDDVGAAIFAAGSGLTQVSRVCEALDAEAKEIWARNAGDGKRYIAAASAYQAARHRLKEVEVRPATWSKGRRELEAAQEELDALKAQRSGLNQQRRAVQRKQLVRAPATRRGAAQRRLDELKGLPKLSDEAVRRCEDALEAARKAGADIETAKGEVERLEAALEGARPAPELLALASEAEALRELKGVVNQGGAEVTGLHAERDTLWSRTQAALAEIGWTDGEVEALKTRLPGRAAVAELRELIEGRRAVDEQARVGAESAREAEVAKARLEARIAELPAVPDVRPLQELVRDLRAGGQMQVLHQAEGAVRDLEPVLAARLRQLAPWAGDVAALRALAAPADEDVDHALARLQRADQQLDSDSEALKRETTRLERLRLDRKQAAQAHPAPTPEDLVAARGRREVAWAPLKAHLRGEVATADPKAASDAFEGTIQQADQIADERFAAAEHAGGLAAREREIESCELLVAQAETGLAAAQSELAAAKAAFGRLIAPLGVSLSPQAYGAWGNARLDALEAADGLDLAREDVRRAQAEAAAARASLAATLGRQPGGGDATLQALLAEAERTVDAAAESRTRAEGLHGQMTAATQALERAQAQVRAATDAERSWSSAWGPALVRAGLAADASVAGTRAQLGILEALRGELDSVLELDAKLAAIGKTRALFDQHVFAAARAGGLTIDAPADQIYAALQAAVTEATTKSVRARTLEVALDETRAKLTRAQGDLAAADAALAPLRAHSPDGDPAALHDLLNRAAEAGRLSSEVLALEAEILGHGDGRILDVLIEEAAKANAEALAGEAEDLDGRLEQLNGEIEAKTAARQTAQSNFDQLDERPDAAIAAFEMEQARSEMAFQAELYIRKRAEARLLRTAVERYRHEKQGPLLTRASALFQVLTLGAFSGLIVDYEDDSPKLAGVRADAATVVAVDGMSDGTVDQLFLALRVAAIEDAVAQGVRLPFVADDLFINYDDERAAAGFKVLAELSQKTQVLFFTHHAHLAQVADDALRPAKVSVCGLDRDVPAVKANAPDTA